MKNLFLALSFLFSAIVAGQQTEPSNSKKQTIEKSYTLQNDSIAKNNVNNTLRKIMKKESFFKKHENNSEIQNNVDQLNRYNAMFNNPTNSLHISPTGKVVGRLGQQLADNIHVRVLTFKTK